MSLAQETHEDAAKQRQEQSMLDREQAARVELPSPGSEESIAADTPLISPGAELGSGREFNPLGPKQQAAFVSKLYQMVSDPTTDNLIKWGPTGDSFLVMKPEDFAKGLCSLFFKHNNWQSFVRQLNMYQFHKVNDVFHASSGSAGPTTSWEFKHALFKLGCVDLLSGIKRKASKPASLNREAFPVQSPREYPRSFLQMPMEEMSPREQPHGVEHHFHHVNQRVSSIEESQRMLMNHSLALYSTLTSYQAILQGMANVLASTHPSQSTQALQNDIYALAQQLQHAQFPARQNAQVRPSPSVHSHGPWAPSVSPSLAPDSPSSHASMMSPVGFPASSHAAEPDSYFRVPLHHNQRGSQGPSSRPTTPAGGTFPMQHPQAKLYQQRSGHSVIMSPTSNGPQILTPPLSEFSCSSHASSTSNIRDSQSRERHLPPMKQPQHLQPQQPFSPPMTSPGPIFNDSFTSTRPPLDRGRSLQSLLNVAASVSNESRRAESRERIERENEYKRRCMSPPGQGRPVDAHIN